jgi:small-conductance mechanosensitive channel/CRP-like cAMP-binding protein
MELLQRLLFALLATVALVAVAELCRRRRLVLPPALLVLIALASWVVIGAETRALLGPMAHRWLDLAELLLLCLAAVRLVLWLALEIPSSLGWWRRPPQLLVQLLMLGFGGLIAVVVVRQILKIELLGLITTSAVLTAVIGFASQGLLKDLIAGLELQLGDDFAIGDLVDLGGQQGVVESVSWRDTSLRTIEGTRLVVPNSKVTDDVIVNKVAYGYCGNRFQVGLDYAIPPGQVRAMLLTLLGDHPLVLSDPKPLVRVKEFGDSAIIYELQLWHPKGVEPGPIELRSELLEQIWYAVHRNGWTIPFPVRELRAAPPTVDPELERQPAQATALACLSRNHIFNVLTSEQQGQMVASSSRVRFGAGETIVREGDGGNSLFLLMDGRVAVIKHRDDGSEVLVCELAAGEVFGEMTLFLDAPRSTTVRALRECELLQVDRDCFSRLIASNPSLLEQLAEQVAERLDELKAIGTRSQRESRPDLLATMRRLLLNLRN